jgi:hypothetical protein
LIESANRRKQIVGLGPVRSIDVATCHNQIDGGNTPQGEEGDFRGTIHRNPATVCVAIKKEDVGIVRRVDCNVGSSVMATAQFREFEGSETKCTIGCRLGSTIDREWYIAVNVTSGKLI